MKECLLYKKLGDNSVQCLNCSHQCHIKKGHTGICGVRQNINGKLYLLVYGKAAAAHIDPIEKKPLFHFLPGSTAFSFGTLGCNFRCANCQNWEISQIYNIKSEVSKYSKLSKSSWGIDLPPKKIVEEALKNHCQSIAYTYVEPTIFLEYALDTMRLARKNGLKNVWVSNGFMSEQTMKVLMPLIDAANIDIKSFTDEFYRTNCGARLQPVLDNCKQLVKNKVWLEITTLIIPTLSDDLKMLHNLAQFIKNELGDFVPWHVSAFSGAISWRLKHLPNTSEATIKKAYDLGKKAGLKYVYAGNVWNPAMGNTYCPECNSVVIERQGYTTGRFDKNGHCPRCNIKIAGVF